MSETLKVDIQNKVAICTLNRPKKLNALSESSTGVEGEQDYWAVQRTIAATQDAAEEDAELDDTEISDLVATALADFTPEQRANFVKIKAARAEASGAFDEWGEEIGKQLPEIGIAVALLVVEIKEGDFTAIQKIQFIAATVVITGQVIKITNANKGIQWLQTREELIKQHEANLKSGTNN